MNNQTQSTIDLDFARQVIAGEAEAIHALIGRIDESFARAAAMLYENTGSVIVTGIGKAGIIGAKISGTLASTGTPSHFLHPAEAVHGDLGRVQDNDILLALSHSGESDEIIRLIGPIKQRQIRLLCMTGNPQSRLARHSDVVLDIGRVVEACPLGIAPSVSTTCMLALGDALALTVMKARQFGPQDYARFHPGGALGAGLITVGQSMMFQPTEALPLAAMEDTVREMLDKTEKLKRRGAVMIVDSQGKLSGIITDADLRRALNRHGPRIMEAKTGHIMTAPCKRVTEDTLAAEAMAVFHKYRIDELPVVDDQDRPVGMIDVQDIVAIKIVG
ncbi:MAG: KpsF/GutQ family sugar-phosphate isomerase [Sedimentisphaerales bacterium]|nr:KpsF/GutQ family sugar-phosphate isomerase [Sedimentisphaerales bacterium]